jgi:hypothetical protein
MDKCLNCGAEIETKYCPHCGQERIVKRLEVKTIFHEITHGILHWENSILNTFKILLTRPGNFVREYIGGKRKSFVKPFSFFLFFQSLYVIIFHWLGDKYFAFLRMNISSDAPAEKIEQMQHLISKNINYLNFILPVIFAFFFKLVLKKRTGVNYAESLVFSFYTTGAVLVAGMFFMLLSIIDIRLWNLRFVFNFIYLTLAISQFAEYRKIKGFFTGALVFFLSYFVFIVLVSIFTILYLKYIMNF